MAATVCLFIGIIILDDALWIKLNIQQESNEFKLLLQQSHTDSYKGAIEVAVIRSQQTPV